MQDRNSGTQINSPVLYHLSHHQNFAGAFLWDSQSSKERRKTFSWLFVPLSEISSQIKNPLLSFFCKTLESWILLKRRRWRKRQTAAKKCLFFLWNGKRNLDWDLTCSHSSCTHSLTHRIHTHTHTPMHAHTYTHFHTPMHAHTHTRSSLRTHPLLHTNTLTCCIGILDLFSLEPDSESKPKTSLKTLIEVKMKR